MGNTEEKTLRRQKVLDTHIFKKVSVRQHVEICKLNGYSPSDLGQKQVVQDQMENLAQTQIVKDLIGHQKNNKQTQSHNRFKRIHPLPAE